jgi:hypothetical protein
MQRIDGTRPTNRAAAAPDKTRVRILPGAIWGTQYAETPAGMPEATRQYLSDASRLDSEKSHRSQGQQRVSLISREHLLQNKRAAVGRRVLADAHEIEEGGNCRDPCRSLTIPR